MFYVLPLGPQELGATLLLSDLLSVTCVAGTSFHPHSALQHFHRRLSPELPPQCSTLLLQSPKASQRRYKSSPEDMDIRDDPRSTFTTTTDYDSGDSLGVDYVYEWQTRAKKGTAEAKSPRRKISPRPKPSRIAKCVCGGRRADEVAETTVFEDTTDATDSEHGRHLQSHPTPSRPSGSCGASACEEEGHHKADKKKSRRTWTPYIEEYPDEAPRPAILLKEHKISRSPSPAEAKRARNSEDRSSSGTSRARSPNGKRPLPRSPRQPSGESPKHSGHQRLRLDLHGEDKPPGPDAGNLPTPSDASEHRGTMSRRPHSHQESRPKPASSVTRSSAWNDNHQPRYSSSWPLHTGAHLPQRHPDPRELGYETDEESEQRHRRRQTRASSFPEKDRDWEREREQQRPGPLNQKWERERDREYAHDEHESERERESRPSQRRPRPRPPRTVISRASMAAIDQGSRCSVATSLCEVWRGRAEDWESPYASGSDDELNDYDVESPRPARFLPLRVQDLPSRAASPPSLLPPPRGQRSDFAFQTTTATATNQQPPDSPESPPPLHLLRYIRDDDASPRPLARHHHHHHLCDDGLNQYQPLP